MPPARPAVAMARLHSRTTVALVLVALVALAGCSGGTQDRVAPAEEPAAQDAPGDGGVDVSAEAEGPRADTTGGEEVSFDSGDDRDSATNVQQRARIWTAGVRLTVDDFESARERIVTAARDRGGYLAEASSRVHREDNRSWTTGRVVVRVPSEEFDATMAVVEGTGTVEASDTSTRDVTDQLVDLEARLESARTERDRLRELLQGANDTEDVLAVQRELSEVQTRIERLEAQKRALEDQVAYSTITVELAEPEPGEQPEEDDRWWETGVVAAFLESVGGVAIALRALVVGIAYALPYALVLAAPFVGGYAVWRRRGSREEAVPEEPAEGGED